MPQTIGFNIQPLARGDTKALGKREIQGLVSIFTVGE
jgi:hypothetical protein